MRLRWWRPEPEPDGPTGWPGPPARLPDLTPRPEPAEHGGAWLDLLPGHQPDPAGLDDHTALYPIVTPAQRMRGNGGGWGP